MSTTKLQHHQTADEDRISIPEKLGLAFGTVGVCGAGGVAAGLIAFIFVMTMGMSTKLAANVGFIQSIALMVLGPIFGQFSDNFRSRWGRRRPLIFITAAPMVLAMVAMYLFPRGLGQNQLALWLLIAWTACSISSSLYGLSLNALGIEATGDYHERVRLGIVLMLFAMGTGLVVQWIFPLIHLSIFGDTIRGLRIVTITLGVIFLAAAYTPLFLCPERKYATLSKKKAQGSLLANMYEARKNRPFLVVLAIRFFTFFCYNLVGALGVYMNTYYMFGGDKAKGAPIYGSLGSAYIIAAAASVWLIYPRIARSWGKKRALQFAACVLILDCLSKVLIYNPKYSPWWQLIVLASNGIAVQGINFTCGTMYGDIIDYDELISGKRREALYTSLLQWLEGIGTAVAGLLCGYLLAWIGFDPHNNAQPLQTLHLMKLCYIVFPLVGGVFCLIMINCYNLTEERAYEIRDELKRRHAADKENDEKGPAEGLAQSPA